MAAHRILAGLLALALLLATLLAAPLAAAEALRDPYEAAAFRLAAEAIAAAQGQRAGATWSDLDKATQAIIEGRIGDIKKARAALADEAKATLAKYRGRDQACERAEIERAWKDVDAKLEDYLKRLRYTRGEHRSKGTQVWRSFQHNALKPIEKLARKSLPKSPLELFELYLSGGGSAVVASVKRRAVRELREDLLMRAASRLFGGRGAVTADEALWKACAEEPEASPDLVEPAAATVTCEDGHDHAPLPPYTHDALLVRVTWPPHHSDALFRYVVTDNAEALDDPFGGVAGGYVGGCGNDAIACGALVPLVLTDADVEGSNVVWGQHDGTFTVTVMSAGLCAFSDGEGGAFYAMAPGQVAVTATLEYYRAGEKEPCRREPLGVEAVPAVDEFQTDLRTTNTQLGTFEWNGSVAGICPGQGNDEDALWSQE